MIFLLLWFPFQYNEASTEYTLYAPVRSEITYLVNNKGDVVHQWKANTKTGHEALLMKDGALLRTGKLEHPLFGGGGLQPGGTGAAVPASARPHPGGPVLGRNPDAVENIGDHPGDRGTHVYSVSPGQGKGGAKSN